MAGGSRPCRRTVCKVVCGTKTVTKSCWCVECEEFCAPLPGWGPLSYLYAACFNPCGDSCCDRCDESCRDPGCGTKCCERCLVPPKCGPVRSKKKLVKKEYECEVPVYRCVVKYLCSGCGGDDEGPPEVESRGETIFSLPPPPAPDRHAYQPALLPQPYRAIPIH